MKSGVFCWMSVACLSFASATVNAFDFRGDFVYVKPLFKDTSPNNAGVGERTITPLLVWKDEDFDGLPDKLKIAFNVWDAGTDDKIRQTNKKIVTTTAPCAGSVFIDDDVAVKFMGATSPTRVHLLIEVNARCDTGIEYLSVSKSIFYSADITTGSSYVKTWKEWEVTGSDSVDYDDDGTNELQLVLDRTNAAGDTYKSRIIYMSPTNGDIEADNVYVTQYHN